MLILTRKEDEAIIINGTIKVTLLSLDRRRKQACIGIEAPIDVSVHREEIQKKIDSWKDEIKENDDD